MLDLYYRLPIEFCGIYEYIDRRLRRGAVKNDIEVIVSSQSLSRLVFIRGERDFTDVSTAFDFNEPNVYGCLRILRVRAPGNQVEATVVGFDALHNSAFRFFVRDGELDRDPLDFGIAHHRGESG